jgi:phosphoglycerate dehydrogenase-like enzyme
MTDRTIRTLHAFHTYGEAIREPFRAAFPDRELVVLRDPAEFESRIDEIQALLALRPPREYWARARRLRLIQMTGAGVDSLLPAPDLPEAVAITNARGVHGAQMPEFAIAMLLALAKRVPRAAEQKRRRDWRIFLPRTLAGSTLGILGLGTIGAEVARLASALGMRVIGTQRTPKPVPNVAEVLPPECTGDVLRESDALVVLLPLTDETRNLLDAAALATLKRGALLVNLARGGIVDEAALARALHDRSLSGAAIDVFEDEPPPQEHPLWDAPNAILTPHVAGMRPDYMERVAELFFANVRRLERGEPLLNPVDRKRGY